jgi:hypothetical protein
MSFPFMHNEAQKRTIYEEINFRLMFSIPEISESLSDIFAKF